MNSSDSPECSRCGAPAESWEHQLCHRCMVNLDRGFAEAIGSLEYKLPRRAAQANHVHEHLLRKRR